MRKPAVTAYKVHELVRERWSPRAFSTDLIDNDELGSLLEAARWAPSCFNEQPWRFLVARRQDHTEFENLLSCLMPANQEWAQHAGMLMLSVASLHFAHNQRPNRHAWHDVGLANAQLILQAQSMGLVAHAMAGFDGEQARNLYEIPADFEPVTAMAIGYPADLASLTAEQQERELAPRQRRPLQDMAFHGSWGTRLDWPEPK